MSNSIGVHVHPMTTHDHAIVEMSGSIPDGPVAARPRRADHGRSGLGRCGMSEPFCPGDNKPCSGSCTESCSPEDRAPVFILCHKCSRNLDGLQAWADDVKRIDPSTGAVRMVTVYTCDPCAEDAA